MGFVYKVLWDDKEYFVDEETFKGLLDNFNFEEDDVLVEKIGLKDLEFFIHN